MRRNTASKMQDKRDLIVRQRMDEKLAFPNASAFLTLNGNCNEMHAIIHQEQNRSQKKGEQIMHRF